MNANTDDLVRWLGAQLDEDERIARESVEQASVYLAGAESSSVSRWRVVERPTGTFVATSDQWERVTEVVPTYGGMHAEHIAAHDPARVLREIDTKRQILRALESAEVSLRNTVPGREPHELMTGSTNSLRAIVRMLATAYVDRPGFREEWRPQGKRF